MKFTTISRKDYFIKQYIIYGCLLFILIILALYHYNKVILQQNEINPFIAFLSQFSLDFSIVLIPVVLGLTNIRKNFRKKFNNLFSMKEKLLHLRGEIAHHFVKFNNIIKRESFILSPLIINEIKILKNKVKTPENTRCLIYFKKIAFDVSPQKRLDYHNMHKKRFYSSLAFFTSVASLLISITVLFITLL